MRRSFLLSRRIHHSHHAHHHSHHRRHRSTRRHPRYHRSQKHKRHTRLTRRRRGGNNGNTTIGTRNGIPFIKNAVVTNSNGYTRSIQNIPNPLNDPETAQQMGDNDI